MVQNGVGKAFMTPLISVLIILGAVSTAVNMVAAMVRRICSGIEAGCADRKKTVLAGESVKNAGEIPKRKISRHEIIAALICCLVDFAIAQFGLLTLIQRAYGVLAYLAIPVIPDPISGAYGGYEI